jgi:hypothetical protein
VIQYNHVAVLIHRFITIGSSRQSLFFEFDPANTNSSTRALSLVRDIDGKINCFTKEGYVQPSEIIGFEVATKIKIKESIIKSGFEFLLYESEIDKFVNGLDLKYHLLKNDCRHFAEKLICKYSTDENFKVNNHVPNPL